MTDLIEVRITVPTQEDGARIARTLVDRRLAACVQVTGPITSTYRWQDGVDSDGEWLMLAKTSQDRFEELASTVRALHDYETPEILAVPVTLADEGYAAWLRESVLPPPPTGPPPTGPPPTGPASPEVVSGPIPQGPRPRLEGIVPVLPVSDLAQAIENYQRLGFTVAGSAADGPAEDGDDLYAFAHRGDAWLHLAPVGDIEAHSSHVAAFIYVTDADQLHAEWSGSGAGGRFVEPEPTPYGMREGAYIDVDGNLLRFGSPLPQQ